MQTIGPNGGEITGAGARILFPAGAVKQPTTFSIATLGAYPDLTGRTPASSVFRSSGTASCSRAR